MLLGFISGFISGLTMVPGYIVPIFMGIVFAIISSLIVGFVNRILPESLKPIFGLVQLVTLIGYLGIVAGALKMTATTKFLIKK